MSSNVTRKPLSIRLSTKAIHLLDALAKEQGITRTATVELMIRKTAEEVEEKMSTIYELLHGSGEEE